MDVIFFLVPNCPLYYVSAKLSWCQIVRCQIVRFYYVGAKLSGCQIVRCQIVLVPNCPGAKLSTFIILVPNCPLLLSWCQIVPFIILVPNCPEPNCPTIKNPASLIFWPKFGMKTWGNVKNAKNSTYLSKNFFLLLLLYLIGKILG